MPSEPTDRLAHLRRAPKSGPSVPNWIPRAVIFAPGYGNSRGTVTQTMGWRATNTQVIVTVPSGLERRFYLETLTEVGQSKRSIRSARLAAPADPEVVAARTDKAISDARNHVLVAIEKQRLQDSSTDAEATVKKLFAIRVAVDEAIAQVGEVL